jgi:DNA-binding CsgD family transcriptional regulator
MSVWFTLAPAGVVAVARPPTIGIAIYPGVLRLVRVVRSHPAERDVTDLVAHCLTKPEIAARLGVSAGTIKDQVSSALRKLGVCTRAELAAAVSSRPGM